MKFALNSTSFHSANGPKTASHEPISPLLQLAECVVRASISLVSSFVVGGWNSALYFQGGREGWFTRFVTWTEEMFMFLDIWEGFPSLWNQKNREYKNTGAKSLRDRSASAFPLVSASKLTLTLLRDKATLCERPKGSALLTSVRERKNVFAGFCVKVIHTRPARAVTPTLYPWTACTFNFDANRKIFLTKGIFNSWSPKTSPLAMLFA